MIKLKFDISLSYSHPNAFKCPVGLFLHSYGSSFFYLARKVFVGNEGKVMAIDCTYESCKEKQHTQIN
jgi:hypothetical protein